MARMGMKMVLKAATRKKEMVGAILLKAPPSVVGGASIRLVKRMANWCLKRCRMILGVTETGVRVWDGAMQMVGGRARGVRAVRVGGIRMISINRRVLRLLRRRRRFKLLDGRCEEITNARLEILLWSFVSFEFGNGQEVFTWSIWTKMVSGS